jgi:hypothetical protein
VRVGEDLRRHVPQARDLLGRPGRERDHRGGMGEQRAQLRPVQVVVVAALASIQSASNMTGGHQPPGTVNAVA